MACQPLHRMRQRKAPRPRRARRCQGSSLSARSHLVHSRRYSVCCAAVKHLTRSSSVFAAARSGNSAQAGVKPVEERGQPSTTRAASREPPNPLANSAMRARTPSGSPRRRHRGHCPPPTRGPVPDRPQARERVSIGAGCQCVGVRGRRCETRGASGGDGNRITDLARGRESCPGKRAEVGCPLAIERERSSARDRVAWTGVRGRFRLEQWQHPFGAIGSPVHDKATVFFAQRYPIGFDTVVRCHFSTVIERTAPSSLTCYSGRKIMV
jgi:hypothetical protein